MAVAEEDEVVLVGGGGEKYLISKLLLSAVSPLVHGLLKDQGFCSGCPTKATILLPWVDNYMLRNLIYELKSSKDCFDGLILNSKTFRLKELARHLGIKTRFKYEEPPSDQTQVYLNALRRGYKYYLSFVLPFTKYNGVKDKKTAWLCAICGTTAKTKRDVGNHIEANHVENKAGYYCPCNDVHQTGPFKRFQSHILRAHGISMNKDQNPQNCPTTIQSDDSTPTINQSADSPDKSADDLVSAQTINVDWNSQARESLEASQPNSLISQNLRTSGGLKRKPGCNGEKLNLKYEPSVKIQRLDLREFKSIAEKTFIVAEPSDMRHESQGNNVVIEKSPSLKCYLCHAPFGGRRLLYSHYVKQHFQEQMMEFASLTQCPMCDKLLNANDAILHMAITHNNLDALLPPEHRIAKSKRGRKKKNVTKDWCKQNTHRDTLAQVKRFPKKKKKKLSRQEEVFDEVDKTYVCYLCQYRSGSRGDLYAHYSCLHFKEHLLDIIGNNPANTCHICGKQFGGDIMHKIKHIGVTHGLVDNFIDKQHQIAKKFAVCKLGSQSGKGRHNCRLCKAAYDKKRDLLAHYVNHHYCTKLEETYSYKGPSQACPICSLPVIGDRYKWRRHLGLTHGLVYDYLKEDPRLQLSGNPVNRQAVNETNWRSSNCNKGLMFQESFSCNLCCYQHDTKMGMYVHHATLHCRESIEEMFGPWDAILNSTCPLCKTYVELKSSTEWLSHLGIIHGIVQDETNFKKKSANAAPRSHIKQETLGTNETAEIVHVHINSIKEEAQDFAPEDFSSENAIDIVDNMESLGIERQEGCDLGGSPTQPSSNRNESRLIPARYLVASTHNVGTTNTSHENQDHLDLCDGAYNGEEQLSLAYTNPDPIFVNEDAQLRDDSPPDSPEISSSNTVYIC